MTGFDDPRGRKSEELAYAAERALRAGDPHDAQRLFAEAALLEELRAFDTDPSAPRVRSILAISAVALWFKARQLAHALTLARHFVTVGAATEAELDELLASIRIAWMNDGLPVTFAPHNETARQYVETREQLDWVRKTGSPIASPRFAELNAMWNALTEKDFVTLAQELMSIESVDKTGEFLGLDVEVDQVAQLGTRALG